MGLVMKTSAGGKKKKKKKVDLRKLLSADSGGDGDFKDGDELSPLGSSQQKEQQHVDLFGDGAGSACENEGTEQTAAAAAAAPFDRAVAGIDEPTLAAAAEAETATPAAETATTEEETVTPEEEKVTPEADPAATEEETVTPEADTTATEEETVTPDEETAATAE
jgi:hypothetical protein